MDSELTAWSGVSRPHTSMRTAPIRAMEARSRRRPGTLPTARPAYVSANRAVASHNVSCPTNASPFRSLERRPAGAYPVVRLARYLAVPVRVAVRGGAGRDLADDRLGRGRRRHTISPAGPPTPSSADPVRELSHEDPLPARLAVGPGGREADLPGGARPRGHQPQAARRGLCRGPARRPGRVRRAPAGRGGRLFTGRRRGHEPRQRRRPAGAAVSGVAEVRGGAVSQARHG